MSLSITSRRDGDDITIVELSGRLTLGRESGQIEPAIAKSLGAECRRVVVDMTNVSYIDSMGVGIIAYCYGKFTKQGVEMRVAGAQGLVLEVFRITRVDAIVRFMDDVETACASLRAAQQTA